MKWVKEEQPRIAEFRKTLDKVFPCLEGDYNISPRQSIGDTKGLFSAQVKVKGRDLKVQDTGRGYLLIIPDGRYRDTSTRYDLKDNNDLKARIKAFLAEREFEEQRAQDYYDRMPIGNTD
jgi:hypothetical protein